jgi:hypothetical protein
MKLSEQLAKVSNDFHRRKRETEKKKSQERNNVLLETFRSDIPNIVTSAVRKAQREAAKGGRSIPAYQVHQDNPDHAALFSGEDDKPFEKVSKPMKLLVRKFEEQGFRVTCKSVSTCPEDPGMGSHSHYEIEIHW